MKIIEVLKFNRELLLRLYFYGIKNTDVKYIALYSDYESMINREYKKTYIVAALAEKYKVSERTVYNVIKRLETDCTVNAPCNM